MERDKSHTKLYDTFVNGLLAAGYVTDETKNRLTDRKECVIFLKNAAEDSRYHKV